MAWHSHRASAALRQAHGLSILTFEQLAARLAGGFLQPIDSDSLADSVAGAMSVPLGELDGIKDLPGFQRAAAASLSKAWSAGLDLTVEAQSAKDPAAISRLTAMATLEREVLARLPQNQRRACDLVVAALLRIDHAPACLGVIEIVGRTEMSPVWRPLLARLNTVTLVTWLAEARAVPDWLTGTGTVVDQRPVETPELRTFSCASPRHEVLEAMRWARRLLVQGVPAEQIAIAAASPQDWDDHILALSASGNLDVHFVHGRTALDTPEGQLVAALAEVLLRGLSQVRMKRLVGLLRNWTPRFAELPSDWWRRLPEDAPLLDTASWRSAIAGATIPTPGVDFRPLLSALVETIAKGLNAAGEIGEDLLCKRARAIWRKALTDGPPAALDVTLQSLRVDDGVEPEASIIWAPAAAVAAVPRPYTWLVGLTSRSWPRRAGEDSLLPSHILPSSRLDPLPVHLADRRDFQSICNMTGKELVCSRARRDSGGRLNGVSSLYPRTVEEVYLAQSREPEHAVSASDRLFARPGEFAALASTQSAIGAWIDWHTERLTAHDGMVRARHPLLRRALDRTQSASSLAKLVRNPLGYLWQYGFGWSQPDETDEPLTLDALSFGNLLHETLQGAVGLLEAKAGGFGQSDGAAIKEAVVAASYQVAAHWAKTRPIPPPVVWGRKIEEAQAFGIVALSANEEPLSGQQSWPEIPFGGDRRVDDLSPEALAALPWDARAPVVIPGTDIRIGGSIDRLDVTGDRTVARVTDYKSGKLRIKGMQLNGGAELQRCLYAFAVKSLINTEPEVDARLLYPRSGGAPLSLDEPGQTLVKLTGYFATAFTTFAAGKALPGPACGDQTNDLAFALPGGAKESYLELISPLVVIELANLAPLWDEP